ncbi:2fbe1b28-979b-4511-8771-c305dae34b9e [Sclerotinia trifoliorum]|uniref:2fbe1b28-979b-4511-8771-c305dae34b9e n=1 Tax=Sclerotinia trifoliorum TaxID=28548 RepID=A0A8H2ZTS5_9HELO|nr:2fbe1b28-979b-4511-8771-c305dae34b9e [Sclerotinia trifoliorum]
MAESTLQDRLREHAEAFDGLLSLIPAKYYYGEDTSDQWKKKKQTKQQAAAARRAKLDPDSAKTAKDVMDERAKKRKLEESEDVEDGSEVEGIERELPQQGLKKAVEKPAKKLKTETESTKQMPKSSTPKDSTAKKGLTPEEEAARLEKRNQKEEQKKAKAAKKSAKQKAKREEAAKQVVQLPTEDTSASESTTKDNVAEEATKEAATNEVPTKKSIEHESAEDEEPDHDDEIEHFEAEGLEEPESTESSPPSSTFSTPNEETTSGGTSISSTIPPTAPPKHIVLPADSEILRSRLAARIEALRAARKASNSDGTPVRNRQELMEQRRKKEEQRKAHKRELRLQAKIDEEARREAALVSARSSPAGSLLSPLIRSPENNFAFGRVAFADGQGLNEDLTALKSIPKKKGPQDVNSALAAAAKKQSRLESMDADKRADIEEKERWLIAKKRVNGEKVRDDSSLLKKTLKRKEKQKKKSEKEWTERIDGVKKAGAMKQKKREANLQARRDGKGGKGKKGGKGGKPAGGAKKKSRPGFEGSFGGGGKKK